MKIAYYLPSLYAPGGLERIVTFKANYLAEHCEGYEVYIITSEQRDREIHFALSPKVKHIDIDVAFDWPFNQSTISKLLKYPFRYHKFRKRFTRLLMDIRPDITLSTIRREVKFIHSIADGSKKVGEFHVTRYSYGVGKGGFFGNLLQKRWEKELQKNLQQLDKFVVLTHEEATFWPDLENICVIPNPIITPTDRFSDCSARQIIAAGRYAPQKGFDILIEAWKIVSKKHPSWILRIYGDGALRDSFQQRINDLEMTGSCILEHTVPNITDKYCESSIFVLSSRFEGFGMVITEAMSCGVPPVSFDCPCGPKDIIDDGKDGLLVENGNIEKLAEKISWLIENENIRMEMGQQARINAQRFRMENIVEHWKLLFEELTSDNQSPQKS
ncbi:glycosyltransferase family 4 protein [Bacteroides sp. GM023]|uniref:glycosyltransferase family 4 protein n=1 Tax=Bacteroides sp. GM023 TaxID=2723058 RepID=UPI00168B9058|nr:glycosyltransferase family 4 protein [Bacteroides sp. GM023]MBD3590356.1 glycosyltransferase family 4 protein [Bacteroides sp. GM023]